jgi:hypothetical protein
MVLVLLLMTQVPTLRDVLIDKRLGVDLRLPVDVLERRVSSYLSDGDQHEFVLAFMEAGDGRGFPKSNIVRWDMMTDQWQHAEISDEISPANSLGRMTRTSRYVYLDAHINPSASTLVALSHDLKVLGSAGGWILETLPDESVVYHRNQTHFAPTHSLEISILNPGARSERQIYPPKPYQPVRSEFIQRVAAAYKQRGEDWFRIHNHHMDPELFDSALVSPITIDRASNIMQFQVRFGDRSNGNDPIDFTQDVLVTCGPIDRFEELKCTEESR